MNTPKISIIVPVYNVERWLRRCIDSILAQTYTDFELLLIDDGSPDSSGKICDEYAAKDERIAVFHKENGGVSTARNLGLDNACGEYVSFVDSDDWVEPNYCQTLIENIGDADIMFFDEVWHFEDGCTAICSSGAFYSKDKNKIEAKILQMYSKEQGHLYFGYTWNKVFRHSVIKENNIRFVAGLSMGEDEVFTLDYCIKANVFKVLPSSPIYNYVWARTGLTHMKKGCDMLLLWARSMKERTRYLHNADLVSSYNKNIVTCCVQAAATSSSFGQLIRSCKDVARYKTRDIGIKAIVKPLIKTFVHRLIHLPNKSVKKG